MADYTYQWCDVCDDTTIWRYPDEATPNDTIVCTRHEGLHVWERSTFGTNMVCAVCGLLPLDADDIQSECEGPR